MWYTLEADPVLHEFVLIEKDKVLADISSMEVTDIDNQNLHGSEQVDMVILSPNAFFSEASRLAEVHETHSGLKVMVVKPEQIYNEFLSGTPDATAYRRFMKMFYDRSKKSGNPPKYLLLFGDGVYDNRFLSKQWESVSNKGNFLLTYQTHNSVNLYSYVVDDYFGFLDDDGAAIGNCKLHTGTGRFPIRTVAEAKNSVDKIIKYITGSHGIWKNRISFVADDGNSGDQFDTNHMNDSEQLAIWIEANRPEYMISKFYFDAYKKVTSSNAPFEDVTKGIKENLKKGTFTLAMETQLH
jgi:hypothetical protein